MSGGLMGILFGDSGNLILPQAAGHPAPVDRYVKKVGGRIVLTNSN